MKKDKPVYVLYNKKMIVFFSLGLAMIILFILIYFANASIVKSPNYASYFRNNILSNIGPTVLTGFHVAILALGMLFMLMASYNVCPIIKCYGDRFEVKHLFHNSNIIPYGEIDSIDTKVVFIKTKNILKKNEKEVHVEFRNKIYGFSFAYKAYGYFDDITINLAHNKLSTRKIFIKKAVLTDIIQQIRQTNKMAMPFLPDENSQ